MRLNLQPPDDPMLRRVNRVAEEYVLRSEQVLPLSEPVTFRVELFPRLSQ